jgi:hypothetical protein
MSVWLEAWSLPKGTFQKVVGPIPYTNFSFGRRFNGVGSGTFSVPYDYNRLDDICDPANNVETLIRVFEDEKNIYSFFARYINKGHGPTGDITINGPGIEDELDHVLLYPFDWGDYDYPREEGSNQTGVTTFSDTIYGGDNVLSNPGFERAVLNEQQRMWHDHTGGTFTLSYDGQGPTSALDWDATPDEIETALQALSNIVDVTVSGSGASDDPWIVEFLQPGQQDNPLMTYASSLTGGTFFTLEEYQGGGRGDPAPWTKSLQPSTGQLHGEYEGFSVGSASVFGDPAHTGDHALGINIVPKTDGDNYPGAQQIVSVSPGGFYQAYAWVYLPFAANDVALVIRDLYENLIAKTVVSVPATTWTQIPLLSITIPYTVNEVIFRVAVINPDNTNDNLWIDDLELNEGLVASSAGQIIQNLWTTAAAEGRTALSWLKHDSFDGSTDSSVFSVAIPTFVGHGTKTGNSGAGGVTLGMPAGIQANDILLLHLETEGEDTSPPVSIPAAWTHIATARSGSDGGSGRTEASVYWHRYDGVTPPSGVIPDQGDHVMGTVTAWRGCNPTGTPINSFQTSFEATADQTVEAVGPVTTVNGCIVISTSTVGDDCSVTTWTNPNVANLTERFEDWHTNASDGHMHIESGELATAGDSGTFNGSGFVVAGDRQDAAVVVALPGIGTWSDGAGISMILSRGLSWLQILERFGNMGFEWKVEWNSSASSYELLFYDSGNMGTDRTSSNFPRFSVPHLAPDVVVNKGSPRSNVVLGEASGGVVDEVVDSALVSSYGRREEFLGDESIADAANLLNYLNHRLDTRRAEKFGVKVSIDDTIGIGPGLDADIGDTVNVYVPPDLTTETGYRIYGFSMVGSSSGEISRIVDVNRYVHYEKKGGTTSSSTSDAVNYLLRQFRRLGRLEQKTESIANVVPTPTPNVVGAGMPTIVIAPFDCPTPDIADIVLTGTDDQDLINEALTTLSGYTHSRWLHILGGTVRIKALINLDNAGRARITGAGLDETIIQAQSGWTGWSSVLYNGGNSGTGDRVTIEHLTVDANSIVNNGHFAGGSDQVLIDMNRVRIENAVSHGISFDRTAVGAYAPTFRDCQVNNNGGFGLYFQREDGVAVIGCEVYSNSGGGINISGFGPASRIVDSVIRNNTGNGIQASGVVNDVEKLIVMGNKVHNNTGTSITLNTISANSNIVMGNVIWSNGTNTPFLGGSGGLLAHNMIGGVNTPGDHAGVSAPGIDSTAIHDNVDAEISAVTEKTTPVGADLLLIEDSAASNAKKRVQITNLPTVPDADAIHDNVSAEISAVTEKTTPVSADLLLIEDSAASNAKKRAQLGNLPTPVTTKGDLYGFDTGRARIPVGTDGHHLIADAASGVGVKWEIPGTVGSDTILDTNSSVTVTHGLGATPSSVTVTPQGDDRLWVTTVGATTFQVNRAGTSGAFSLYWRADL